MQHRQYFALHDVALISPKQKVQYLASCALAPYSHLSAAAEGKRTAYYLPDLCQTKNWWLCMRNEVVGSTQRYATYA
jgi:hypothetical protein